MNFSAMTNEELLASTKVAAADEHTALSFVMEHLTEVEARRAYLDAGCTSLYIYCHEVLGYSEHRSRQRMTVARLLARFPAMLPLVRTGKLHLSALRTLGPALDEENHVERLNAAIGKTRDQLERMVAAWTGVEREARSARLRVLSADLYELTMDIPVADHDELMKAQALLRHSIPDGDLVKIYRQAIHELVERTEARQFGKVKNPERAKAAPQEPIDSRSPNRAIKREVAERDQYRCTFVGVDGHRCTATSWLQHDHRVRVADDGPTSVANTRLMCAAHNQGREDGHESRA